MPDALNLPSPASPLQQALFDGVRARLSRLALVRPREMQKKAEAFNVRGVLISSIAVEGYLQLDVELIEALAKDSISSCVDLLNKVEARTGADWDYARNLTQAAIDHQVAVASDSLRENATKCNMRTMEIPTRQQILDKALATLRDEVDARFSAERLASAPRARDEHRAFMETAIVEARKCVSEDGRISPRVGVVVVKDGKVIAQSHRGESGDGRHAEYVALEEKLKDISISGATLYTTLEPCTSRNPPKIPCASRVVERRIQKVVIGMLDPDTRVHGKGVFTLRDASIEVELFPAELMSIIEELNREFSRSRRSAALPPATSAAPPPKVEINTEWVPKPEHGKPGYELGLTNRESRSVNIAILGFEPPKGFAISKGTKDGGWHQDPTIERPRLLLEQDLKPGESVYVGRLSLRGLNSRLTNSLGIIRWRITGRDGAPVDGFSEVDIERMLPSAARPALSTKPELTFGDAADIAGIAYRVSSTEFRPSLITDEELHRKVLKSANPDGDAYLDLLFDPTVTLDEFSTVAIRLKARRNRHFMMHLGISAPGRPECFVTFKLEDGPPRRHSDYEWIVPLGSEFLKEGWITFERDVREDFVKFFGAAQFPGTGITLVRLRGDYLVDSVRFRGRS